MLSFIIARATTDSIFASGFSQKKIPTEIDAIVIGSGIGGLTTAAILAKANKKVLVLEQHDQAGGCCHTFTKKGFEFDVGEYLSTHPPPPLSSPEKPKLTKRRPQSIFSRVQCCEVGISEWVNSRYAKIGSVHLGVTMQQYKYIWYIFEVVFI